nr:MAG TPA: hypothetical protein [Caudoviricetes sp.]
MPTIILPNAHIIKITVTIHIFKNLTKSRLSINTAMSLIKNRVISSIKKNRAKLILRLNNNSLNPKHLNHTNLSP